MTVNVQPTLEGQVKIYGAEAERMRMASERLRMSVDQFIEYAIQQLIQEILADEADWQKLSLEQFQKGLDNPEDAIYDNWREHYGVPAR